MRKKLIFRLLAILFLSLWPGYAYDTAPQETGTQVAYSVHGTYVESAVSSESVDSNSQDIALKNPTFQELKDFILSDPTSHNEFILNQYECRHFATDVNNNAEAEGLRAAFVLLGYDRGQHAVIAFDTVDRGLVYIEPQTDAAIHPEVGGKYQGKEIKEILVAW
ncbi:hypothetical protein ES707_21472 [subsurface metagenome]